jgi:hypothetical protein
MKRIFLRIFIFMATFGAFMLPVRRAAEMLWTKNVSSNSIQYFPVLVRSSQGKFAVDNFFNLLPESKLVTYITDHDIDEINSDLRSSMSIKSNHPYFQVVGQGEGYMDVSLEVPTTADFWPRGWYRIENSAVHPQRIIFYGPLGIIGFVLPGILGIIAVLYSDKIIRKGRS